jgi:hypothetical protein
MDAPNLFIQCCRARADYGKFAALYVHINQVYRRTELVQQGFKSVAGHLGKG